MNNKIKIISWRTMLPGIIIAGFAIAGLFWFNCGCSRTGFKTEQTPYIDWAAEAEKQAAFTDTVKLYVQTEGPCWQVSTCDQDESEAMAYWYCFWRDGVLYRCNPPAARGGYLTRDELWEVQVERNQWLYDNGYACDGVDGGTSQVCFDPRTFSARALPEPGPAW